MTDHIEIVKQLLVLPVGLSPEASEVRHFAVTVEWRGRRTEDGAGGYAVEHLGESLSRAGKWAMPQRYQYRQYRWETLEEAVEAARAVVDSVTVSGMTYAQWAEKFGPASEG